MTQHRSNCKCPACDAEAGWLMGATPEQASRYLGLRDIREATERTQLRIAAGLPPSPSEFQALRSAGATYPELDGTERLTCCGEPVEAGCSCGGHRAGQADDPFEEDREREREDRAEVDRLIGIILSDPDLGAILTSDELLGFARSTLEQWATNVEERRAEPKAAAGERPDPPPSLAEKIRASRSRSDRKGSPAPDPWRMKPATAEDRAGLLSTIRGSTAAEHLDADELERLPVDLLRQLARDAEDEERERAAWRTAGRTPPVLPPNSYLVASCRKWLRENETPAQQEKRIAKILRAGMSAPTGSDPGGARPRGRAAAAAERPDPPPSLTEKIRAARGTELPDPWNLRGASRNNRDEEEDR